MRGCPNPVMIVGGVATGPPSVAQLPSGADVEFIFSLEPLSQILVAFSGPGSFDAIANQAGANAIQPGPNNTSDWLHLGFGQLQYQGAAPKLFLITGAISGVNSQPVTDTDGLFIGIGGNPIPTSGSIAKFVGAIPGEGPDMIDLTTSITARVVRVVNPGQVVELFMQSAGTGFLTVVTLQLTVTAVG